jgi:hypothetical protein
MRTILLKKRVLFFIFTMICFFQVADAIAENSTGSSAASSSSNSSSNASSSNSGSGVNSSGTTIQVSEGSFTPATMPTGSGDLAKKSTAAAAAAKAGAAMQQVNCMQMQAQAAAEQDPEAQYWKQMAAGMQCAQASQSQQSAEKNEENAKSLSGADIPKAATFTAGSVSLSGGNSNESSLAIPTIETASKSSGSNNASEETIAPTAEKTAEEGKAVAGNSTKTEEQKAGVEVPLDVPKSALNPIQNGPVVFDDSAKAAGGAVGAQAMMGNAGGSAGTTTAKNEKTASSEAIASEIADIERGIREINSAGGEGSGGDSDAPKSSGMLDALMAQLNPEAPQMGGFGGGEAAAQTVSLEKAAGKESKVNIFEYATYRYQMAAGADGRVQKAGAPKKADTKKVKLTATLPPTDLLSASRTQ